MEVTDCCPSIVHIVSHAEEILLSLLWPDGPVCPDCGSHEYTFMKDGRYRCKGCTRRYSPKVGTIFQSSHIPLSSWLIALYLMLENKGLSSCALSRYIDRSQPTCYNMMMKLRFLFGQEDVVLEGEEIAVDEVYVGGTFSKMSLEKKNYLLSKFKLPTVQKTPKEKISVANRVNALYKTPVIGVNSGEKLILKVVPKPVVQGDIVEIFKSNVKSGSHTVSDCSGLYDDWFDLTGCDISHNNHSKGQYKADDGKSSNKIEGSFSQWKRQSLDKFCFISPRLLQLYLDEHCFRFNYRNINIMDRMSRALTRCKKIITRATIKAYDSLFGKSNNIEIFDPVEFFKTAGSLINEIKVGGIVYRAEEFRLG